MKFIYHFRVRGTGPEGVHIAGISMGLRKLGHTVHFVSPTGVDPTHAIDVESPPKSSSKLLNFLADKMPQLTFELLELSYNLVALQKLNSAIVQLRPDAIYERYAFFSFAGVHMAKRAQIPIIIEVNEVSGLKRIRGQCMTPLAKRIENHIFSKADIILTVSDFLRDRVVERGGDPTKTFVIPNAVEREKFLNVVEDSSLKQKYGIEGKTVLGFVGLFSYWHRFDLLLEAFAMARRQFHDLVLLLVGDGPERGTIEKKAEKFGVKNFLIITGMVSHKNIPKYINLFDVAIIPHTNEFRSPIKLFEYMAIGKVVVAPDVEPIRRIVEDMSTGLLFRCGDMVSLQEVLLKALQSFQLRKRIGRQARELILERYTWENHARRIVDFFEKSVLLSHEG